MSAPPPILYLVSGDDEFLVGRAVAGVVRAASATDPDSSITELHAGDLLPDQFSEALSPSLFGGRRVVVVRGGQDAKKDLIAAMLAYAADPDPDACLVVAHTGGAKGKALADGLREAGATVLPAARLTRHRERVDFVRDEIRRLGGKCDQDAAEALLAAVGSELRELAAACAQLIADTVVLGAPAGGSASAGSAAASAGGSASAGSAAASAGGSASAGSAAASAGGSASAGGRITAETVGRYYRGRAEVSGFTVADAAMVGDVPGALEALRWALQVGVDPVPIADALADGVRTVSRVAAAGRGSAYQLAGSLGLPPWKVERAQRQARGWTPEGLVAAMRLAAECNASVKGGSDHRGYALERAIVAMTRARRG